MVPDPRASAGPVVHVVDDDDDLRQSLEFLFGTVGITALTYPDATTFLEQFDPEQSAVVVVDVRMPVMNGFQLQQHLVERDYPAPIVFCSAHGDISMSVRALRAGAVDFLEKPYGSQKMLEVVQAQVANAEHSFSERARRRVVRAELGKLTPREREVLGHVVSGLSSQLIARRLGTTVKTVDVHRARIKAKTGTPSLGTLVHDILIHGLTM